MKIDKADQVPDNSALFAKPMVCIRDSCLDAYQGPQMVDTVGAAVRSFGDMIKDPKRYESTHPEHFSLWCVGLFNLETGQLIPYERPKQLALGTDYVTVQKV